MSVVDFVGCFLENEHGGVNTMKILENNKEEKVYGQKKCPFCSCDFIMVEPDDKEKIKYDLRMKGVIYYILCPRCGYEVYITNDKKDLEQKNENYKKEYAVICVECGKIFDAGGCKIEKWRENIWEPFFVYIAWGRCVECPHCKKKVKIF